MCASFWVLGEGSAGVHGGGWRVCWREMYLWYDLSPKKTESSIFLPRNWLFLEYFGSFRNKMWSGGKRRDVKTNNTFCVALFQSKMPLVGLTSAGKKAYSPVRVAACSHRTLFKLHQGFFTLVYPSVTWDRSCVPTRPTWCMENTLGFLKEIDKNPN